MRNLIMNLISETMQQPKVAAAVVATTTGGSILGVSFDWLHWYEGMFAAGAAAVLSIVLSVSHYKKMKRDDEKHQLEIKILKKQLDG